MTATEVQTPIHADTPRLLRSTRKSLEINVRVLGKCLGNRSDIGADLGKVLVINSRKDSKHLRHFEAECASI